MPDLFGDGTRFSFTVPTSNPSSDPENYRLAQIAFLKMKKSGNVSSHLRGESYADVHLDVALHPTGNQ
jgi:hypothetical protein